jgi:hypothetical protein
MSTLREVGESQARLAEKYHEPQGATGSRRFAVAFVIEDRQGRTRKFARASLRELGFTEAPRWGAVVKRVLKLGGLCSSSCVEALQAQLPELADVFRPVMKPINGRIAVCHGGGILPHSVRPPSHRLMLDTEVVFEKAS